MIYICVQKSLVMDFSLARFSSLVDITLDAFCSCGCLTLLSTLFVIDADPLAIPLDPTDADGKEVEVPPFILDTKIKQSDIAFVCILIHSHEITNLREVTYLSSS